MPTNLNDMEIVSTFMAPGGTEVQPDRSFTPGTRGRAFNAPVVVTVAPSDNRASYNRLRRCTQPLMSNVSEQYREVASCCCPRCDRGLPPNNSFKPNQQPGRLNQGVMRS